ncbi:MAG: DUF433 domain-containing protein [Saprospiraceae bacterium]
MIDWKNHIDSDAKVLLGKPIIKGTRISVELILELYSGGWSTEEILESYPSLRSEDIRATFAYLKDCISQELFFPIKQAS